MNDIIVTNPSDKFYAFLCGAIGFGLCSIGLYLFLNLNNWFWLHDNFGFSVLFIIILFSVGLPLTYSIDKALDTPFFLLTVILMISFAFFQSGSWNKDLSFLSYNHSTNKIELLQKDYKNDSIFKIVKICSEQIDVQSKPEFQNCLLDLKKIMSDESIRNQELKVIATNYYPCSVALSNKEYEEIKDYCGIVTAKREQLKLIKEKYNIKDN